MQVYFKLNSDTWAKNIFRLHIIRYKTAVQEITFISNPENTAVPKISGLARYELHTVDSYSGYRGTVVFLSFHLRY